MEVDLALEQLSAAGLIVDEADEGYAATIFADIGALAWYLRSVPWAVPGFSISAYRNALIRLHGDPIRVTAKRFWVRAPSNSLPPDANGGNGGTPSSSGRT